MPRGLPLITSAEVYDRQRVTGASMLYRMNDHGDLVAKLLKLALREKRERPGNSGEGKMARAFSWEGIARRRL